MASAAGGSLGDGLVSSVLVLCGIHSDETAPIELV
ncbi:hypothetical protein B0O95_11924 [Mycetohabitans endofungorum]|uniref:Uncharacterized protein n=1 Tax=Mycetohabitans endofungorum TaxID=417203 RepID=A0A2P5K707_9BURK|nr:hypothetical protein B0O95_11924 [Mycetohabitans endofungorum]